VTPHFTISCVIQREACQYYSGNLWYDNIRLASLYTPAQAQLELKDLMLLDGRSVACLYVIQNRHFDYYDGEKWVYDLSEAKLYDLPAAQTLFKAIR
jgi:hypothetical protein